MQLLPVIDLMAGQVVRGVRGERSAYRPIRSSLCESSAPLDLAPRLLARAASDTLYIADLDALMGGKLQFDIIAALLDRSGVARQKYPEQIFFVDQFPTTASGKIKKDLLRKDAQHRHTGGPATT